MHFYSEVSLTKLGVLTPSWMLLTLAYSKISVLRSMHMWSGQSLAPILYVWSWQEGWAGMFPALHGNIWEGSKRLLLYPDREAGTVFIFKICLCSLHVLIQYIPFFSAPQHRLPPFLASATFLMLSRGGARTASLKTPLHSLLRAEKKAGTSFAAGQKRHWEHFAHPVTKWPTLAFLPSLMLDDWVGVFSVFSLCPPKVRAAQTRTPPNSKIAKHLQFSFLAEEKLFSS